MSLVYIMLNVIHIKNLCKTNIVKSQITSVHTQNVTKLGKKNERELFGNWKQRLGFSENDGINHWGVKTKE